MPPTDNVRLSDVYDLIEIVRREAASDRKELREYIDTLRTNADATHDTIRAEYRAGFGAMAREVNGEGDGKGIKGRLRDLESATAVAHSVQALFSIALSSVAAWFGSRH